MNTLKRNLKRLTALLLCAVMMLGALPLQLDLSPKASAAWSTQYVEKMRQLGIMAGDGTSMAENRAITRADLERVEQGENLLSELGFRDFRLRLIADGCKLQVTEKQFSQAWARRGDILTVLSSLFHEITLDLRPRAASR